MMGEIYQHACRVIVWLPASNSEDVHRVHDTVKRLEPYRRQMEQDGRDPTSSKMDMDTEEMIALEILFRKPWFRRTWVVQEVTVQKNVVVRYGRYDFPLDNIRQVSLSVFWRCSLIVDMAYKFLSDVQTFRKHNAVLGMFMQRPVGCHFLHSSDIFHKDHSLSNQDDAAAILEACEKTDL